jgi:Tfp pilus assembly protein PilX
MWRQRLIVVVATLVMAVLAVSSMGLILLHMRPISPDKIEMQNLQ